MIALSKKTKPDADGKFVIIEEGPNVLLVPDNGDNDMADSVSQFEFDKLKQKYESLKRIIINTLIALDWLLKVGMPIVLFFWPAPQDHLFQSIGAAIYIILLTIISKTITKVSVHSIN